MKFAKRLTVYRVSFIYKSWSASVSRDESREPAKVQIVEFVAAASGEGAIKYVKRAYHDDAYKYEDFFGFNVQQEYLFDDDGMVRSPHDCGFLTWWEVKAQN